MLRQLIGLLSTIAIIVTPLLAVRLLAGRDAVSIVALAAAALYVLGAGIRLVRVRLWRGWPRSSARVMLINALGFAVAAAGFSSRASSGERNASALVILVLVLVAGWLGRMDGDGRTRAGG